MRRRLPLLTAALTLLLALPARPRRPSSTCASTRRPARRCACRRAASSTSVTVIVGRPGGAHAREARERDAPGDAVRRQRGAQLPPGTAVRAGWTAPPERRLAITDSTGDSVTVPFGVASFQTAHGGFSGRAAPARPAGRRRRRRSPTAARCRPTPVSSGSFDSGEIATPGAAVTVTATRRRQALPRRAQPAAVRSDVSVADGATSVTVHGADPAGGPVAIDLTAPGGALIAHTSAAARIGAGLDATATLPVAAPPGSVVTRHRARGRPARGSRPPPSRATGSRSRSPPRQRAAPEIIRASRAPTPGRSRCTTLRPRRAAPTRSGRAPHSGPTSPP